jgi:hypothetical protein
MKNWIVDLQSFGVEAETAEEAKQKAIEMLESGEQKAYIDAVIEDPYEEDEERV